MKKLLEDAPEFGNYHYKEPDVKDLAVGFVFFNPMKSKRMLMNYLYTVEMMKAAKIPTFTLELVLHEPEIFDEIHVTGSSIMYHTNHLFNL